MKKTESLLVIILTTVMLAACGLPSQEMEAPTVEKIETKEDAETDTEAIIENKYTEENENVAVNEYTIGLAPDWRENALNLPDDKYRTYYEIFVYSFCDSDNDGIGDLKGVISKLDYLNDGNPDTTADLNVTGIWLMPVMPSPSYHKYDTTDYMGIDEQYGSTDDMKLLLDECHSRGINVIIDLAMNHSSSEHIWFKNACKYLQTLKPGQKPNVKDCPYLDYYNFSDEIGAGYCEVEGTDWYYEANFNYDMPDLNLDNEAVRKEFEGIASFWLEMGVDGFRLDAVKYFETGNDQKNIETLKWFNDYVKKQNPNAYIVCENWSGQNEYSRYYESGVDSLFDFSFANKDGIIANVINKKNKASSYGKAIETEEVLYSEYNDEYINAPFYTNHDMGRSAGYYTGDDAMAKAKMGQAMNLLMPGNAFIYYGEELGMKGSGKDENKRAPMYWSDDANYSGMCDGPENMEPVRMKYGSYEEQSADKQSIYSFVKDCIRLRNQVPTIARGKTTLVENVSDDDICVMLRSYGGEHIYIVYNISPDEHNVDLSSISEDNFTVLGELYAADNAVSRNANTFSMPGYSILVLMDKSGSVTEQCELSDGEEYLTGYASEKEFKTRHTGSVGLISDRTVLVSVFVNEPEDVWIQSEKDDVLNTCTIAYDFIHDELKSKYKTDTDLIYNWKMDPELAVTVNINEEIPAYVSGKDGEKHMDALEDEWVREVDAKALMEKYECESIGFLYLIPHEGCSYTSQHFIEDSEETWNEGCLLYLEDMYSPTYERETPVVYAHELLHMFGAEDYYSDAGIFSNATYGKLKSMCSEDIMLKNYDMINGVYTTYHDEVRGEISPVTAYLLGIVDEKAIEELPELKREEKGTFPGSNDDRPF